LFIARKLLLYLPMLLPQHGNGILVTDSPVDFESILLCHISSIRGDTHRRTQISSDVADFEAPHSWAYLSMSPNDGAGGWR
jgi:hypothetical protein